MLPIKLLSSNRKFLKFLIISLFFFQNIIAEEKSIDIWNNKNKPKSENNKIQEKLIQEPKIDISKLNQNQNELIKISEPQSEDMSAGVHRFACRPPAGPQPGSPQRRPKLSPVTDVHAEVSLTPSNHIEEVSRVVFNFGYDESG